MHNNILALVRNIKIKCTFEDASVLDGQAIQKAVKLLKKEGLLTSVNADSACVYKKSIDARNKNEIYLVYTIAFHAFSGRNFKQTGFVEFLAKKNTNDLFLTKKKPVNPPLVIGFGPSGMFCALALAKAGLNPIVIERGSDVDKRAKDVSAYWNTGVLDKNSNVQFGEGGAGTFSDGKLLTRISDDLCGFVMSEFVRFGAPSEIMYLAKPHVGTDKLRNVVKNIRHEIIRLGGSVIFNKTLTSINTDSCGNVYSVSVDDTDEISCSAVFVCIGHSARDTVKNLMSCGVQVNPKPFSVGVRIEHLQQDIDESLYGDYAGCPSLGAAQYTLSRKFDSRAVYSFCMCPGGVVVASASDNGQIVTNGMSYYARDGKNANSAIAVSVDTSDFGNTVDGAISFQDNIERAAFDIAGGDGTAPIQLLGDFFDGKVANEPSRILPTYTGKTVLRNADDVFPEFITNGLRKGISMFERDITGFSVCDAVLTFPETRTSSAVKIPRNENYLAHGFKNLYPCGEGAGYAGGITSAAVDGLRAAISYLNSEE